MRNLSRFTVCVSLVLALLAVSVVFAQDGGTLAYGGTATGEITNERPAVNFTFTGQAGDTIMITMTATGSGLDSFLELHDPTGVTMSTDDDSAGNMNSRIGPVTLPVDGTFTIVATRCCGGTGGSVGTFQVAVNRAELLSFALGQPVTASLPGDGANSVYYTYVADGVGPQYLSLTARPVNGTGTFSIDVREANGNFVNQAGQPGGSSTPVIMDPLVLQGGSSYLIVVHQDLNFFGPATLMAPVDVQLTLNTIQTAPFALGNTINGVLSDNHPADHYSIQASASDLLRLAGSVPGTDQPIEVQIYSPAGYSFNSASTAYSLQPNSFALDPLQFDTTGTFLLVVRRTDVSGTGIMGDSHYTLTLGPTETPALTLGVEQTGIIDPNNTGSYEQIYRFQGSEGQSLRITLRSVDTTYGPSMDVQGPNAGQGTPGIGGGGGGGGVSVISVNTTLPGTVTYEVTLATTGNYLFRVHNGYYTQQGPVSGQYSLLVAPGS